MDTWPAEITKPQVRLIIYFDMLMGVFGLENQSILDKVMHHESIPQI